MSPLRVPNFGPIRTRIRVLWRILRNVRNEDEGKNEEIETKFCSLVSRKWLERFCFQIWYVDPIGGGKGGARGLKPLLGLLRGA